MDFLAVSTTSYYFMEVNFSISFFFFQKRKKEEKEKPRKTITTALPKKTTRLFLPGC